MAPRERIEEGEAATDARGAESSEELLELSEVFIVNLPTPFSAPGSV